MELVYYSFYLCLSLNLCFLVCIFKCLLMKYLTVLGDRFKIDKNLFKNLDLPTYFKHLDREQSLILLSDVLNNCVCTGRVPDLTSLFLPTSFCMSIQSQKEHRSFLSPLPPGLQYWISLTSLMHIVAPCVLQTYTTFKANTQNPFGHDSAV